ncbi:hypothetical protein [Noviluteimonas gilva]|uniref:Uncharacterized protein n=1 Tax=Noviluteimonas gilva TaxID=2682097 RepID=A0A7C9HLB8_9GAMM|nr:hypothetical protein [Lysobacter gilvus]MUV13570.1 hypothetical protein [Lysobacter gilvus]
MSEELEEIEDDGPPEDVMHGPDGSLDCINGRFDFIAFWLAKLGIDDPAGAALSFGEGCSVSILHPVTGEWLTPQQIAKKAGVASVRSIQ